MVLHGSHGCDMLSQPPSTSCRDQSCASLQELAKQGCKRRGRQAGHLTQASNATLVAPKAGWAARLPVNLIALALRHSARTVSKGPPAMQPFGAEAKPRVMHIT